MSPRQPKRRKEKKLVRRKLASKNVFALDKHLCIHKTFIMRQWKWLWMRFSLAKCVYLAHKRSFLQDIKLIFETTSTEQRSRERLELMKGEKYFFFLLRCKKTPHIIIIILKCLLELEKNGRDAMKWKKSPFFFKKKKELFVQF